MINRLAKSLPPMQKITSKDAQWQRLRESFLGTWKHTPAANVKKLRSYLGPVDKASQRKLCIVLNYLTGTGFRMGKIKHPTIDTLRNSVKRSLKRFTQKCPQ